MALKFDKKKALLYGGGFAAFLIVVLLLRKLSGSSGSGTTVTTTTATGPTAAQIQASTSIALANIDAATQANALSGQLAIQTQAQQADLQKTTIQANVALHSIDLDSSNQQLQIRSAAQIAQNTLDANTLQNQTAANLQASIAKWTIDANLASQASNNAFQLDYAEAANTTQEHIANILAQVTNTQVQASRDVSLATISAGVANTNSLIAGQVAINDTNQAAMVSINKTNADVTKYTQGSGNVKGVLGFLGGLF